MSRAASSSTLPRRSAATTASRTALSRAGASWRDRSATAASSSAAKCFSRSALRRSSFSSLRGEAPGRVRGKGPGRVQEGLASPRVQGGALGPGPVQLLLRRRRRLRARLPGALHPRECLRRVVAHPARARLPLRRHPRLHAGETGTVSCSVGNQRGVAETRRRPPAPARFPSPARLRRLLGARNHRTRLG